MSLQTRLNSLISAIGADVKSINTKIAAGTYALYPTMVTASMAVLANTHYIVNCTTAMTLTFPPAPPNGTRIKISRIDISVAIGCATAPGNGTDVFYFMPGYTALPYAYVGANVTNEYEYFNGTWYNLGSGFTTLGYSPNGGYPLMIDPNTNRPQSSAAPTVGADLVNKTYADLVGQPVKLYEEYQPAPKTTTSGWQLIVTGSPVLSKGGLGNMFIGGYGTAANDGLYEIVFTVWLAGTAAAGRLLGQVSSGNVAGSGTTYARAEYAVASGGSATYNFPTVNVVCRKYLTAGSVINASFYVSGAYVGIASTYGTLSVALAQTY